MKRLIKKSEFYDGYMKGKSFIEVYKNPTSKEMNQLSENSIRYFVHSDGTIYAWDADILHEDIAKKFPNIVSSVRVTVSTNGDTEIYITPEIDSPQKLVEYLKKIDNTKYNMMDSQDGSKNPNAQVRIFGVTY